MSMSLTPALDRLNIVRNRKYSSDPERADAIAEAMEICVLEILEYLTAQPVRAPVAGQVHKDCVDTLSATDILDDLRDLQKQATTERSHYYVAACCARAMGEIIHLRQQVAYGRQANKTLVPATPNT